MTTQCIPAKFSCPTPHGARPRRIEADVSGGTITSHGGLLLVGLAERSLDLFARVAACFDDARNRELIIHEVRILGFLTGLEDLNDHEECRKDPVGTGSNGASPQTDALLVEAESTPSVVLLSLVKTWLNCKQLGRSRSLVLLRHEA